MNLQTGAAPSAARASRLVFRCMVMLVVVGALAALPRPASAATIQGVLESTSTHNDTYFTVQLDNGTVIELPERPVSMYGNHENTVPIRSTIIFNCTLSDEFRADGLVGTCLDLGPVTVLSTPSDASVFKVSAFIGTQTTGVTFSMVMGIINMSACGFNQPITPAAARSYLNQAAAIISGCSYGQMNLDMAATRVEYVQLPCTAVQYIQDQCDVASLMAVTNRALGLRGNRLGSVHTSLVLPAGTRCERQWSALAQVAAPQTWFTPGNGGIVRPATIVQELLHNFGLHHASVDQASIGQTCGCEGRSNCRCHVEYGDMSTPMGEGDACLNAPEMYRINWATAIASLDSFSLRVGSPVTYTLPATHTSPASVLLVKPTWLAPNLYNLYFSLRTRGGADSGLLPTFDGKVSVHRTNQAKDALDSNDSIDIHFLNTISPNTVRSEDYAPFNLVVSTGALVNNRIPITLCRFQSSPDECARTAGPASPPPAPPAEVDTPDTPDAPVFAPPPPSPPARSSCADRRRDCAYWASLGYCTMYSYAAYMARNCPVTCGIPCTLGAGADPGCEDTEEGCGDGSGSSNCTDLDTNCDSWVASFGCEGDLPANAYIAARCPSSCSTCGNETAALSTGQQCVDLSSACATFQSTVGCDTTDPNATLWLQINCQETCNLCPASADGISVSNQLPLGCAYGYSLGNAAYVSNTTAQNFTDCYQQCFDAPSCFLFTYQAVEYHMNDEDYHMEDYSSTGDNGTCLSYLTVEDVLQDPTGNLTVTEDSTLCVIGTNRGDATPEVLTWFTCISGLDISGTLVSVQQVSSELECAEACNNSSNCRIYTLLYDNSCILKSNMFAEDFGSTGYNDEVNVTCIQTFYTTPANTTNSSMPMYGNYPSPPPPPPTYGGYGGPPMYGGSPGYGGDDASPVDSPDYSSPSPSDESPAESPSDSSTDSPDNSSMSPSSPDQSPEDGSNDESPARRRKVLHAPAVSRLRTYVTSKSYRRTLRTATSAAPAARTRTKNWLLR